MRLERLHAARPVVVCHEATDAKVFPLEREPAPVVPHNPDVVHHDVARVDDVDGGFGEGGGGVLKREPLEHQMVQTLRAKEHGANRHLDRCLRKGYPVGRTQVDPVGRFIDVERAGGDRRLLEGKRLDQGRAIDKQHLAS